MVWEHHGDQRGEERFYARALMVTPEARASHNFGAKCHSIGAKLEKVSVVRLCVSLCSAYNLCQWFLNGGTLWDERNGD